MQSTSLGIDPVTGRPDSYASLFVHYRKFVELGVSAMGIPLSYVSDVASEIMTVFMERDCLSWYDGDKLFDISTLPGRPATAVLEGPQQRRAKFASYLRRFIYLYSL